MNYSVRQKLAVISIVGCVSLALLFFFILKPLALGLNSLHSEVQGQKDALSKLISEEESYKSARADLERIKNRAGEISAIFPNKEKLVGHIERLESAASKFGDDFQMSITDATEEETAQQPKIEKKAYDIVPNMQNVEVIPYQFNLAGSFLDVVHFFQTMENQPFFSEVESFTFNSERKEVEGREKLFIRSGITIATVKAAFYAQKQ